MPIADYTLQRVLVVDATSKLDVATARQICGAHIKQPDRSRVF